MLVGLVFKSEDALQLVPIYIYMTGKGYETAIPEMILNLSQQTKIYIAVMKKKINTHMFSTVIVFHLKWFPISRIIYLAYSCQTSRYNNKTKFPLVTA